ncbi:hypothetical protein, partial [Rhizobium sp. 2TAF27]|uniref:hypothetical protein n=1 Tax=Rhizobium sp. 2TAF27 TaxID=3233013 RepID=UPI003F9A84C9
MELVQGSIFNIFHLCGRIENRLIDPALPHKHNAARRHHIGKMKFKVTNWAEYEAALRPLR